VRSPVIQAEGRKVEVISKKVIGSLA